MANIKKYWSLFSSHEVPVLKPHPLSGGSRALSPYPKEMIKTKFNKWSQKRILEGKKCMTSRSKRHDNDEDVLHVVGPLPLWFICAYLYKYEGADNPQELKLVFNQIFRKDV
jgi:hypothetical protein